jgi:hypothetical protein
MNLQEQLHRIKEVMGILKEDEQEFIMLPMDYIKRPNGAVGTQGFTSESLINLVKHISNVMELDLPEYESVKDMIYSLRENPNAIEKIVEYVKNDPVTVNKLPDDTYHLKDGNHRANLLNLLNVSSVPTIISQ